eukprot:COSAG02_NODE_3157_length_7260_cov_20.933808_10_plen_134_part_00
MTSSSMKNEASPEIQHLNQQITLIDTQAKVIRDECFQRMSVLYQLPSGDRRRIEAKDFKSLKSLQLDQGISPEKGMKFLIWTESVLKLSAPQWLLLWPTLSKLMSMNKHLDTFRFPTRTELAEQTAAEVKSMW